MKCSKKPKRKFSPITNPQPSSSKEQIILRAGLSTGRSRSITIGHNLAHHVWRTYGARLHGGDRVTVDRKNNSHGQSFVQSNPQRALHERSLLLCEPVYLTRAQRLVIESEAPAICTRGGWMCLAQAAGANHVHLLIEAHAETDAKTIRRLIKRWLSQLLNERFGQIEHWWAEGGSTKAIKDEHYLNNVIAYIGRQSVMEVDRAGDDPARSER